MRLLQFLHTVGRRATMMLPRKIPGIRQRSPTLLACPFFLPTERFESGGWFHPSRLPLGAGWKGVCCAPGFDGTEPGEYELREHCNLGYAVKCSRLPQARAADAVRFSIVRHSGDRLTICYVCEAAHHPVEHGNLEYDQSRAFWPVRHPDDRLQKMAQCYVEVYLQRRIQSAAAAAPLE